MHITEISLILLYLWWARGDMKKQELGKESDGVMQGLEVWASAVRERVWGLCGFWGPQDQQRRVQWGASISLKRENGQDLSAFCRNEFQVGKISVL